MLDSANRTQTPYREFLDHTKAKAVRASRIRVAYDDLFTADKSAHTKTASSLKGWFRTKTGVGDKVAEKMATTFRSLAQYADFSAPVPGDVKPDTDRKPPAIPEDLPAGQAACAGGRLRPGLSNRDPPARHAEHRHVPSHLSCLARGVGSLSARISEFVFKGILASHSMRELEMAGLLRTPAMTAEEQQDQDLFAAVSAGVRGASIQMQRCYRLLFVFENLVREFLVDRFQEADWNRMVCKTSHGGHEEEIRGSQGGGG